MENCCENTDREIWKEHPGDAYSHSIHVTKENSIGINCGGHVIVMPIQKWHIAGKLLFKCIDVGRRESHLNGQYLNGH